MQKYRGKSTSTTIEGSEQKRGSLSLADASWLSLLGQRLLEGSDEVLSAAFWGFECVHSSRVVRVRHVMGIQEGGGRGAMFTATKGFSLFISCCLLRNTEVSDLRCTYIVTLHIVHHTAIYKSVLRTNSTISY